MSNNSKGFFDNNATNSRDFKKGEEKIRRRIIAIICLIIAAIIAVVVIFYFWGDTMWGLIVNIGIIIGLIAALITIHDKICSNNKKGD